MRFYRSAMVGAALFIGLSGTQFAYADTFHAAVSPLPKLVRQQMQAYTWRPSCPVSLNDLAYVKLSYWGFDQKTHVGVLIVNKQRVNDIVKIFSNLYDDKFPLKSMKPMYFYRGDDDKSMADNNTSAFNCRPITGTTHKFSQHSYGTAVDINPLINPYVKGETVLPPAGAKYLNRTQVQPGMITANSHIYQLFTAAGWQWGGSWQSLKDYQHFEKPLT